MSALLVFKAKDSGTHKHTLTHTTIHTYIHTHIPMQETIHIYGHM